MGYQSFNAGAAFAFLDDVATRFGQSGLLAIEPAWDAAWITCVTLDPRHEATAQAAMAGVVVEVDRLSALSIPARTTAPAAQAPP